MSRNDRLKRISEIPSFARMDHRFFIDEFGQHKIFDGLSRKDRRRIKSNGKKLSQKYKELLLYLYKDGAGFPVDQLLRHLCIEYNHRFAASGTQTQPLSFNYFEPFCGFHIFENSTAPYLLPREEVDFLFSIPDYMEFITSSEYQYDSKILLEKLNNGQIYNFTQMGSVNDFSYLTSDGSEFLISGFSMVRIDNSLFWYLLGGERLSDEGWEAASLEMDRPALSDIPPEKRPFLSEALDEAGKVKGGPICLEGTTRTIRTIIAGETDILSSKHLARSYMAEYEQSFLVVSDDPDIFDHLHDEEQKSELISNMSKRIEKSAVMWNLVEALFGIPIYLDYKISIDKLTIERSGSNVPKTVKGGRVAGGKIKYIKSINVTSDNVPPIQKYTPPLFSVETDGYWKRLNEDQFGYDRDNKLVKGRTWIKSENKWRDNSPKNRTIYAKSLVTSAKLSAKEIADAANEANNKNTPLINEEAGVLYVMRCVSMQDGVYKVGWTSRTAKERADELSAASGVPSAFAVVDYWKIKDPEAVERAVHAILLPYRINESREFFKINYQNLKLLIMAEIERSERITG